MEYYARRKAFLEKTYRRLFVTCTNVDRDKPVFTTITNIYPGAQYYERDVHEFFGVEFEGNPDSYKQLFLENWDDIPPLRKDFDAVAYSDRKYPARKYKANFSTEAGESK